MEQQISVRFSPKLIPNFSSLSYNTVDGKFGERIMIMHLGTFESLNQI